MERSHRVLQSLEKRTYELDSNDTDGLFAECVVLNSIPVTEQVIKAVSFRCRDCIKWRLVHDDEISDCFTKHDVGIIHPVHCWHRDGVCSGYVY